MSSATRTPRASRRIAGLAAGAAATAGAAYWLMMSPYSQTLGPFPYRGPAGRRLVALTFDDGPNEPYTSQLADYLDREGISATFFQVGRAVQRYPEVTTRLVSAGHVIGFHGHTHDFTRYLRRRTLAEELEHGMAVFAQLGIRPALYRPPWLLRIPALRGLLHDHGLQAVSGEFCHPLEVAQPSPERIARHLCTPPAPAPSSFSMTDAMAKAATGPPPSRPSRWSLTSSTNAATASSRSIASSTYPPIKPLPVSRRGSERESAKTVRPHARWGSLVTAATSTLAHRGFMRASSVDGYRRGHENPATVRRETAVRAGRRTSSRPVMHRLTDWLLGLHGLPVYGLVGLLVFAEDALFVGFVLPGETAAVLGGVAASVGHASLPAILVVVIAAAIVGDTVGYEVGRYLGPKLLGSRLLKRRAERLEAARKQLAERGGTAVFLGRFVAFFRATMPALAGMSGMRYPKFLAFNAAGGIVWGTAVVLIGYLAGSSYAKIEKTFGRATALIAVVVVLAAIVTWRIRHRRSDKARQS